MRRFKFRDLEGRTPGSILALEREEHTHLFKILRARAGDEVLLMNGAGLTGMAKVLPGAKLELLSVCRETEPQRKLSLYIAPPRKQKMDLLLKQMAELGVWRIVPILCARSVVQPEKDSFPSERWENLLFEGCKQSGNPFLPEITPALGFAEAVCDALGHCGSCFFGSPRMSSGKRFLADSTALFIGPEGGFSPEEEAAMEAAAFLPLRIGAWTLRVETAAVAGIALLAES